MRRLFIFLAIITAVPLIDAATKPHVISFGKPTTIKVPVGPSGEKSVTITVRPLYLDTKLKEYTTGHITRHH